MHLAEQGKAKMFPKQGNVQFITVLYKKDCKALVVKASLTQKALNYKMDELTVPRAT